MLASFLIFSASVMMFVVCCTTTRTAESKPAPQYYPPDPYDKNGVLVWTEIKDGETFTATEDGLFLPFWYWKKVYDYIVNTQAAQEIRE